jgi:redox-sensitive bicupin YhaK (pirin superfamily)
MNDAATDGVVDAPHAPDGIEVVVVPLAKDLGGFEVRRALPSMQKRMVGPFVFWDQMGLAHFGPGQGIDVRPHPHIGLATVTYVIRGEIMHRDSLGNAVAIRPGELNLMTAGKGIVHSERTGPAVRAAGHDLFGIQAWIALPESQEECEPRFDHFGAMELPVFAEGGATLRLIAGEALGLRSPVTTPMAMIYADAQLLPGARLPFDTRYAERAIYTMEGEIAIDGARFGPGHLVVLKRGSSADVRSIVAARFMMLGGEPMDGPRHLWWNFVSSRRERIEQAKSDWTAGRFAAVPGETDFIPLPP